MPAEVLAEYSDPESASKLLAYFDSPELEHFCFALAQAYLIERSGKKSIELVDSIENEFYYSLMRWFEREPPVSVLKLLFAAINEAVLTEAAKIARGNALTPALQAQLVQTASALASASARNTTLLQGLSTLQSIYSFQSEFSAQVCALHATMRLPHAGTTRQVPYDELFVAPNLWPTPSGNDVSESGNLAELLQIAPRVVVLGDPGGGKSTQARKLTFDIASKKIPSLQDRIPFLVTLKDYASTVGGRDRQSLIQYITGLCTSPYQVETSTQVIEYTLLNDRAVVVLDGLDELLDTSLRREVAQAVEGFAHRYPTCPIVVTSRRVGYEEAPLDDSIFVRLELGGFSAAQVALYVEKWFALDESAEADHKVRLTRSFIEDSAFVSDLRSNPLLLSLMCGIYASESYIPSNRPDVYEKCALLLFDRWDKQRGIVSPLPFDAHVQSAMRSLALYMFADRQAEEGIPRSQLIDFMRQYLLRKRFDDEDEAANAAEEFIDFCKGRAWVLSDVGAELYGFTHRTFMEYFAASQLVRENPSADGLFAKLIPHLRDESWDVVSQLAVQILGRTIEDGADDFLDLVLNSAGADHPNEQQNLLQFACRALEFVVPRPSIIKRIATTVVDHALIARRSRRSIEEQTDTFQALIGSASVENRIRLADLMRVHLLATLRRSPRNEAALMMALASPAKYTRFPQSLTSRNFWHDWCIENRPLLENIVERQRQKVSWVAILEYEWGNIGLEDALGAIGIKVLYDYRICGMTQTPPIAYRYLNAMEQYPEKTELTALIDDRIAPEMVPLAASINRFFVDNPAAQLQYRREYEVVASRVDNEDTPPYPDKLESRYLAAVLVALPLMEIRLARTTKPDITQEDDPPRNTFSRLMASRVSRHALPEIDLLLRKAENDHPGEVALINSWIRADRSFVCDFPNRRMGAAES